jgi:hypothetical protein
MRPTSLKQAVERAKAGEPLKLAINEFLDEFYINVTDRQRMIEDAPPLLDVARDDAYVGAVGEHLGRRWGLRVPEWSEAPERFFREPYFDGGVELLKPYLLMESPLAFRRRMIFTELEPLRRARFPRGQRIESPYL